MYLFWDWPLRGLGKAKDPVSLSSKPHYQPGKGSLFKKVTKRLDQYSKEVRILEGLEL